jgi:predicted MFS family arabinose efflux permease
LAIGFLDELASAVPSAGAPDVHQTFPTSLAWLAAALLGLPTISGILLEAPLLAASDRWPRKHLLLAGSLVAMAAAFGLASAATSLLWVGVAMALAFPAMGLAGALAEATLIGACANADERARAMARWSIAGAIGDTCGPLLLVVALGWRGGAQAIACVIALVALAIVVLRPETSGVSDDDEADEDTGDNPRAWREVFSSLKRPQVLAWLFATALCSLLDETLIAFAALHWDELARVNGYGALAVGAMLAAFSLGAGASLLAIDVVMAKRPGSAPRVLVLSAALCAVAYGAWLAVTGPYLGTALFFCAGATAAPLWPLCQARVYDLFPKRPGLAAAAGNVFSPLDIVFPIALGLVGDGWGVIAALGILIAQPIGILILIAVTRSRPAS